MLKLRRSLAVNRGSSPIIRPHLLTVVTLIDHGLNGEYMARFHDTDGPVLGVVRNRRGAMEQLTDSVRAKCSKHRVTMLVSMLRDNLTKIYKRVVKSKAKTEKSLNASLMTSYERQRTSIELTRLTRGNSEFQAFVGHLDELLVFVLDVSDQPSFVDISVISVVVH